ncbi:MAG: ribosome small subunit-dependent GTPase A [Oligoflexia bacterium]|nr:ribosome small subunit-dependent GTPase A [Oligoflexia bacterium]
MVQRINPEPEGARQATVVSASRRWVELLDGDGNFHSARSRSKALELVVGDKVLFEGAGERAIVTEILPAKNCIARSYREQSRRIAANLDRLFIVTAVGPLFNTYFVDRLIAVAHSEFIPFTLIINKIDLGLDTTAQLSAVYQRAGVAVLTTSAKSGENMQALQAALFEPTLEIIALCGISGVGKSTLLNQLIPGSAAKTAEVSSRTGQGRQTTTQSYAYMYKRSEAPNLLIIDLPGVQSFGVTHLSKEQVADAFAEICELRSGCRFGNCSHISEEECAIKSAVEDGTFPVTRYVSYCKMIEEIESAARY